MLKWSWITIRVIKPLKSSSPDLGSLDSSASYYLEHAAKSKIEGIPVPRNVMDGIFPILEKISSGKCEELFKSALDQRMLSIATVCCNPPSFGINHPAKSPGDMINIYDGKHKGRAFREICIGISKKDFPIAVAETMASAIISAGTNYGKSVLVENGIHELGDTIAGSVFNKNKTIDQAFVAALAYSANENRNADLSSIVIRIQKQAMQSHLVYGSVNQTKEFCDFMDNLSGDEPSVQAAVIYAFSEITANALSNLNEQEALRLTNILLTVGYPTVDKYRKIILDNIDQDYEERHYLKAALSLIGMLKKKDPYEMERLASIYSEAGSAVLTDGIIDRADYVGLSELPGLDMALINVKEIPRQARGAAIETELGI